MFFPSVASLHSCASCSSLLLVIVEQRHLSSGRERQSVCSDSHKNEWVQQETRQDSSLHHYHEFSSFLVSCWQTLYIFFVNQLHSVDNNLVSQAVHFVRVCFEKEKIVYFTFFIFSSCQSLILSSFFSHTHILYEREREWRRRDIPLINLYLHVSLVCFAQK